MFTILITALTIRTSTLTHVTPIATRSPGDSLMCFGNRVQYTYWDYFRNAFAHNWGWRIDHILATAPLAAVCRVSDVDLETRRAAGASDHALVWAEFDYGSH